MARHRRLARHLAVVVPLAVGRECGAAQRGQSARPSRLHGPARRGSRRAVRQRRADPTAAPDQLALARVLRILRGQRGLVRLSVRILQAMDQGIWLSPDGLGCSCRSFAT